MAKINKQKAVRTHEGAKGRAFAPEQELRRTLMACMLWEDQFYENGETIAARIGALVPRVKAETVAAMAVEAREDMKLRHAPLLIVREMARHETHRGLVADTLERVIQRPDELTEFLAIYWADALGPMQQRKKAAVSAQAKKGLARAFAKFDVLACPSTVGEAPAYDPAQAYGGQDTAAGTVCGVPLSWLGGSGRFTTPYNYSGYPTLSLPCGFSPDGLPLSLQLVGRPLAEDLVCRAGFAYESATDWHRRHPPV